MFSLSKYFPTKIKTYVNRLHGNFSAGFSLCFHSELSRQFGRPMFCDSCRICRHGSQFEIRIGRENYEDDDSCSPKGRNVTSYKAGARTPLYSHYSSIRGFIVRIAMCLIPYLRTKTPRGTPFGVHESPAYVPQVGWPERIASESSS